MGVTAIICIAAVVVVIVIILTILVYNQMLLLNEVNKRLLLMAKESVDRERSTMEELQVALISLEQQANETQVHIDTPDSIDSYHDSDLDI
jgi:hypothetical protein